MAPLPVPHDDDLPVGRLLTRKEALRLLGGAGAALVLAGCAPVTRPSAARTASATTTPGTTVACVVRPALTEGPYFVDERLNRSDIRADPSDGAIKPGAPLRLTFQLARVNAGCAPLAGATLDVWHCDALGVYSDVSDPGFNTIGQKFLRGYQVTDASGAARFTTIYPGWYQGRAVHIHFKVRMPASAGATHEFTSQLFFDDTLTDQVHAAVPYRAKGQRTLRNSGDAIYQSGGSQLVLAVSNAAPGYTATFAIGLQL
jgi:protocatechuate 3,4-dioxygenase beta subunit